MLVWTLGTLLAVTVGFALHSVLHYGSSIVALLGAGMILLVTARPAELLREVEWATLACRTCGTAGAGVEAAGFTAAVDVTTGTTTGVTCVDATCVIAEVSETVRPTAFVASPAAAATCEFAAVAPETAFCSVAVTALGLGAAGAAGRGGAGGVGNEERPAACAAGAPPSPAATTAPKITNREERIPTAPPGLPAVQIAERRSGRMNVPGAPPV